MLADAKPETAALVTPLPLFARLLCVTRSDAEVVVLPLMISLLMTGTTVVLSFAGPLEEVLFMSEMEPSIVKLRVRTGLADDADVFWSR